mmetsp:Transcript_50410/g.90513  ORF Transcript_50410/g.90513 Transcript_50410/m.90513 type:complete len:220 (+) Transcript_50410:200-859(+)
MQRQIWNTRSAQRASCCVRRYANLGVVGGASATKGHRGSLHHLLHKIIVLHDIQCSQLATKGATAAEEVLKPSHSARVLCGGFHLVGSTQLLDRVYDLLLVSSQFRVQLQKSLHRTPFIQAVHDRSHAGFITIKHGLRWQRCLAAPIFKTKIHLTRLKTVADAAVTSRGAASWTKKSRQQVPAAYSCCADAKQTKTAALLHRGHALKLPCSTIPNRRRC